MYMYHCQGLLKPYFDKVQCMYENKKCTVVLVFMYIVQTCVYISFYSCQK